MPDTTFSIRPGEHHAIVNGRVVRATWPDKGSALAGLRVEQRREERRQDTNHSDQTDQKDD